MSARVKSIARLVAMSIALVAMGTLVSVEADARSSGGRSIGSRGDRTFAPPPSTATAPRGAQPIDKSFTQNQQRSAAAQSAAASRAAAQPSRFGGMFKSLLLGGLMGAALASLFGGGAFSSMLGFLLQTLLIGGVIYLVVMYFRNRSSAGPALATAGAAASAPRPQSVPGAQAYAANASAGGGAVAIGGADFSAFERLLGDIQSAYGRGDLDALGARTTPEMLSYFAGELSDNRKKGVRNEVGVPKLLQGDLAESWREASGDYATVAMRYALTDATVNVSSGQVVSGSRTKPDEVTELWTFRRPVNGGTAQWELSAIQQA